ncbi:MAG: 4a-hydroxytetrahydrobiopterin dehydratase [Candidatus Bipolaricaulota bacterium]
MSELTQKECVPCEGGVPPLEPDEVERLLTEVNDWEYIDAAEPKIKKSFKFKDFNGSMDFVNQVAEVAEAEGHHPNIDINYNRVEIVLYTHAIDGLHENDFILAAKIDELV